MQPRMLDPNCHDTYTIIITFGAAEVVRSETGCASDIVVQVIIYSLVLRV
jgi:hypothetical protein